LSALLRNRARTRAVERADATTPELARLPVNTTTQRATRVRGAASARSFGSSLAISGAWSMRLRAAALLALALTSVSCGGGGGGGGGGAPVLPPSPTLSTVDVAPSGSVVANGVDNALITVTVRDALGNPLAHQPVEFSASGSQNTLTALDAETAANGVARATLATLVAESKTIVVTAGDDEIVLSATPAVAFIGDAATIDAALSSVDVTPSAGLVANGIELATITVAVRDAHGNAVPGQIVEVQASGADNTIVQPVGPTDAAGLATATLASTRAQTKAISALVNPGAGQVALAQTPTVEFIGDASTIDAAGSSLVVTPAVDVVADGSTAAVLTVTVRDAHGNPVAGQAVQVAASGSANTLVQPAQLTNAAGIATASLATTAAESKTLSAIVNPTTIPIALLAAPTVTFIGDASTIDAALSNVSASPSTGLLANDLDAVSVEVVVRDAHGNPVAGQLVQLSASGTGNTIAQPLGATDAAGLATAALTATTAETKTLTITVNPGPSQVVLGTQPLVEFVADASQISALLSSASVTPSAGLIADGLDSAAIAVVVRDAHGNPVAGQTVAISASGAGILLVQPSAPTGTNGSANASIASTVASAKQLTVTINPGAGQVVLATQPSVEFIADASQLSAALSSASATPSTGLVADGVDAAAITVVVRDVHGNPVPGQIVAIAASGSGNALIQPSGPTDASGAASASIASTVAEAKQLTVTINPGAGQLVLSTQPSVEFIADAGQISAVLSSASAVPSAGVVANGVDSASITVVVRDVNGNPVPGQVVLLAASGSDNTLDQPAGSTDASGAAGGSIASTKAESKQLTVTINPGPGQIVLGAQPSVEFIADASQLSAALSSASASPSSGVVADGVQTAAITVVVRDVNGNPVAGQLVELAASGASNTLLQPSGSTDASGESTATIASTTAEQKQLTVTLNPGPQQLVLSAQPTVEFIADASQLSAALSSASATPSTGLVADGVDSAAISVVVRDVNGNPVAGQTVAIAASGTGNVLVQPAGPTDASGAASASIASTVAESKQLTITINPGAGQLVLGLQPTVEFIADASQLSAALSSASATPITGLVANGLDAATIEVVVRDAHGNPVPGQLVEIAASGSGNTLVQPAGPTDASGTVTASIASTGAASKLLTITINPGASQVVLSAQPTVEFLADASQLSAALSSASASPISGVVANDVDAASITVIVRDVNGNPVPGQIVAIAASGTGNALVQPAGPTNASGVATASIASTKAELKQLTVTVNPGAGQLVLLAQPSVEFIADASQISAVLSSASALPGSGLLANGSDSAAIGVVVRDAHGNPVPGQLVELAASGTGNALQQPLGLTDASGATSGSLASTDAELKHLTVTINPGPGQVVLAAQPAVEFVASLTDVSGVLSEVVATPALGVVANGLELASITVTVRDAQGSPVAGQTVQLAASGTDNTLVQPAAVTDAFGIATGTLASTHAETKTIVVTVNPGLNAIVLADTPTVAFVGDPSAISAALSTVGASPSANVVANGTAASTITVAVRDVHGNAVAGQAVQLAATGAGNTLVQPLAVTNALGIAVGTLASTQAEAKTVSAIVNPGAGQVALASTPAVEFVGDPSTISAALSSASAVPIANVVADGVEQAVITIVVRDAHGNPVAGQTVQLAASGTGNTLEQPAAVTDSLGLATGALASIHAGTKTLTITINPGAGQVVLAAAPTVGFVGDPSSISAALSSASATPSSGLVADGVASSAIAVTVRDANGNPVAGQTVQLAASGTDNVLVQPAAVTDALGVATGTLASTHAESKTVSITVNPGAGQVVLAAAPTVDFVGDPSSISAALSSVSASPSASVVADGRTQSTITVVVRDAHGNPVAGQSVQLAASGTDNALVQPAAVTNALGLATGTLTSTHAETKSVTALVNPGAGQVALADAPTVEFIGDASTISATLSSGSAVPSTGIVADGVAQSTITFVVRDAHGNPVAGQAVQLAASGSDNTIEQPAAVTNALGIATGAIASTHAEPKSISVTINPGASEVVVAGAASATFVGDPSTISALLSTASASPTAGVVADGSTAATITVTVRDANGNPVADQVVQLAASGASNTLVQPIAATNALGIATGTLGSTQAETKTVTVTINPGAGQLVLADAPTVGFVGDPSAISAALSTLSALPNADLVADGLEAAAITVTVRDVHGNAVPGVAVELASSGTGNALVQPAAVTDALGVATGSLASTHAQTKIVSATVNPGAGQTLLASTASATFVGDPSTISAALSAAVAAPSSGVVADGATASTITVVVRDANGNPVAGQSVQLAASGSDNTLVQPAALTDALGVATGTLASTLAETKTIGVVVNPGASQVALADAPTVGFVGDPSAISAALSTVSVSPGLNVVADGVTASTITVTVRDVHGNAVPGQSVQLGASGTANALVQPAAMTNALGVASGTLASTKAEGKTIAAIVNPGAGQIALAQAPTIEFVGDPSTISAALSSGSAVPSTDVVADGLALSTISFVVRDAHGNPVAGQTIQLAASGTDNTIVQPAAVTDASGSASGTLASTHAELKTIAVTINPGAGQVVVAAAASVGFVGDPSTISAALSSASASPSAGVVADGSTASTITVTVRDAHANPVAGQLVQLAASGSSNTLVQPASVTNALGIATGTLASTHAESKTVSVVVNPGAGQVALAAAPTVGFVGDPSAISAALSSVSAVPDANVVADGLASSTITVAVRDVHGNAVPGVSVQLASSGSDNTIAQPAAVTDALGIASGTLASTHAESKVVSATVNPGAGQTVLAETPSIGFVGDPSTISAALSSASASPSSGVVADGAAVSTISVTVRDAHGNAVAGQTVQLSASGSSNTLVQPVAVTDALGVATGTIASTLAETKTIGIVVNPGAGQVGLAAAPTVGFVGDPSTISAALSTLSASPNANVVANGTANSTITVTVRDANGNPVAGQTVQLAASGSSNTLVQPVAVTNALGIATGTLASTLAETKTVTAIVNPGPSQVALVDAPTVGFVGDPSTISAALSSASASPNTGVVADGATLSTISVTVRDANGNAVAGQSVQLAASGTNNTLVQPVAATDALGVASGTLASTRAETKTVTVVINPGASQVVLASTPTVAFVGDPSTISAALSTMSASPSTGVVANGTASATITVTVRDAHGNAVAGQTVQLAASGTDNTLVQPAAVTSALGTASGTLASTHAETKALGAIVNPGAGQVALSAAPTVVFTGDPSTISASLSSVGASPSTGIIANGVAAATITVTVRDANGNPVAGQSVQLAATGTGNTLGQPAAFTNAAGVATGTLASTVAATKTISAIVNPGVGQIALSQTPTAAFVADASTISASLSLASATPSIGLVANGLALSTISVTVRDAHGNPVSGQVVQLSASGTGNIVVQPLALTNASGVATGTLASILAATKTITVTVNPGAGQVVLSAAPTVAFIADVTTISALLSTVNASPAFGARANGTDSVSITVTVRDANGNPVSGQNVALAATGSSNTLAQPLSTTNASGQASGTIKTSIAEYKTLSAVINPGVSSVSISAPAVATFVWPAPSRRFVRASGSDSNDGMSPQSAWQTLSHAASSVSAGLTVYVGAGTYSESVAIGIGGTQTEPITFLADESGEFTGDAGYVVVDALGASTAFSIDGVDDVEVSGFRVTGTHAGSGTGFEVGPTTTRRVKLRRNSIYSNGNGIRAQNAVSLLLEGNRISRSRRMVMVGSVPVSEGGHAIVLDGGSGATVRNNLLYANEGTGLWLTGGVIGGSVQANTLYANESDQIFVDGLLNVVTLSDNAIVAGLADGIELALGSVITSSFNLSFGNAGFNWLGLSLGSGDQAVDPAFVDPDGADDILGGDGGDDDQFQLDTLTSLAIDAGSLLSLLLPLDGGLSLADLTSRVDGVLDGTSPDGGTANVGFHYDAQSDELPALVGGDARVTYAEGADRQPKLRSFDGLASTFGAELRAAPAGATTRWQLHGPSLYDDDEELLASAWVSGSSTGIAMQRWSGQAWHRDFDASWVSSGNANVRSLALAYEGSGDALFVWADGSANPKFRVRHHGEWTDEAAVFGLAPGLGAVAWMELASRTGSDEITLVYADSLLALRAVVWNGTSWNTADVATLEILLRSTTLRCFDVEYEESSGDALIIWAGPLGGVKYARRASGASSWSTTSGISGLSTTPSLFDLAAEPGSDRIAMAGLEDSAAGSEPKSAIWSGSAWSSVTVLESGSNVTLGATAGDLGIAAGWIGTGTAIAVYADNQSGRIDWARWTSGTGWVLQSDFTIAGKGTTESVLLAPFAGSNRILALLSDSNSDLYAASYDGSTWTLLGGGALETSLSTIAGVPFAASTVGD